jgi:two-component system response regulator HydG
MKVLVVDDDVVLQRLLASQLDKLGFQVTLCGDGRSAMDSWERERHPIVLLDLMLPDLDGRQFSRRLRAHPYGDECVIVVITSRDSHDDLHQVLDAGADDYLIKPVNVDVLNVRMTIATRQFRTIIARKRAESGLRDSELQISSIMANAPLLVFGVDRDGRISFSRGREFENTPMIQEGLRVPDVFDDIDIHRDIQRAMRGPAFGAVRRIGNRTFDIWYSPRIDANANVTGVTSIATDITARIEAEERLRRSVDEIAAERDEIRSVLHRDRSGVVIIDADERVAFHNPASRRLLGIPAEVFGRPWDELLPVAPDDLARIRSQMSRRENEREKQRVEIRNAGGGKRTYLDIEVCNAPRVMGRWVLFAYDVSESVELRKQLDSEPAPGELLGRNPFMQVLQQQIREAALVDWVVLVEGAPGSGRTTVAQAIHAASRRRAAPFVVIDCATLSEAALEDWWTGRNAGPSSTQTPWVRAIGGTLFVDGVDALPHTSQHLFQRWLEDRELGSLAYDMRIVVGTRRDLSESVERGDFMAALLSRFRAMRVRVPSLRDRRDDIPLLCHAFIRRWQTRTGSRDIELSRDALQVLLQHRWPGNVRELQSVLDSALAIAQHHRVEATDLPLELRTMPVLDDLRLPPVDERQQIMDAIERAGGNRKRAALLLGMSRATLYRRLDRYGISREDEGRH